MPYLERHVYFKHNFFGEYFKLRLTFLSGRQAILASFVLACDCGYS